MRGGFLPDILRLAFSERPELRARLAAHFGVSDWKISRWMARTAKPEPTLYRKVIDYVEEYLGRPDRPQ